jgi:hypothetical protein
MRHGVSVHRVILANLRRRTGRALALLLGVLVATTGFTVLTGSTETARLQVTGTVGEHYRGPYDILVRPAGARTDLEEQRQLVRPNFLSGGYGGSRWTSGVRSSRFRGSRWPPRSPCSGTGKPIPQ